MERSMRAEGKHQLAAADLRRLFVAVWLLFATAAYAQSQKEEAPLTAALTLGFDSSSPARRIDAWTPLSALIENRGDAIKGRLLAQVYYGLEATNIFYSCPVDLPTGSRKMYRMPVFLSGEAAEVQVSVEFGRNRMVLGQLATPAFDEQFELVGALTRERNSLNFLASRLDEPEEEQTIRQILYVESQVLPTHWIAYQGLDALVWAGGQAETVLAPEQIAAFRSWLTMGGRLILFVGALRQELLETPWAEFSPLELSSTETLPAGTLLEGPLFGERQSLSRPVVVSTGTLLDSLSPRVLLHAGDIPIVVEVEWGAGTVVYCAFEPQPAIFTSAGATLHLWDVLLAGLGSLPVSVTNQLDPIVSRFLRSLVQAELPSAWFIAGFLGLYILLVVPVNYLVFRRYRRLEWAWLMVPVWAVVFTVAAYDIGAIHQRGTVDLNVVSVIEAFPDSTRGRATSFISVYSPVRHWYDVRFPGNDIFPHLVAEEELLVSGLSPKSSRSLLVHYDPDATVISDVLIHHWSQRMVKAAHSVDLGKGVSIDLAWENTRLVGTITNQTPYTISDPTLYVLDRRYRLGQRLWPGERRSVPEVHETYDFREATDQLADLGLLGPGYPRGRMGSGVGQMAEFGPLYRCWLGYDPFGKNFSLLTGWVEHLFVEPKLDRSINQREGRALLAVLFSTYSWPAGIIRIPPTSWHVKTPFSRGFPQVSPVWGNLFHVQPGQSVQYTLMTDFALRGAEIHRLRIDPSLALIQPVFQDPRRVMGQRRLPTPAVNPQEFQFPDRVNKPPGISIQNSQTKEWKQIIWRLKDELVDGAPRLEVEDVADPQLYVKLRSGTIKVRIDNPGPFPILVDENSLGVMLDVEYRGYIDDQLSF